MQQIENLNTLGQCTEEYCSRPATMFELVKLKGLRIYVALCLKHTKLWEELE